jgi:integrase
MATRKPTRDSNAKRVPKVRIARPANRPFQLRYTDAGTQKEIRISIKSRDEADALRQKEKLEAKLTLGICPRPKQVITGGNMPWESFRDEYSRLKVSTFHSEESMVSSEVRLDVCERIVKPRSLADMCKSETLSRLQAELRAGAVSRKKSRAASTTQNYLKALLAALNWAHDMEWIEKVRFRPAVAVQQAKGDPVTADDFSAMLEAVEVVCPHDIEGWQFYLKIIWTTGLRRGEVLAVSWDDPEAIRPKRDKSGYVVLEIPAMRQKNKKTQTVPTIPAFAELLDTVPLDDRTGWLCNPVKFRGVGRYTDKRQVGRIVSKIGEKSGTGKHAHDIRRGFGQRMADAGIPPRDLQLMMRHASYTTTEAYYLKSDAAASSRRIGEFLKVYPEKVGTVPESADVQTEVESS